MSETQTYTYQRILTPIGLGMAISLLGDATLYTVLPSPEIAALAGVSLFEVGILLGLNRIVRVITNGTVGYLLDRLPRRPVMVISLAIGALSTAIYALGSGFWVLALGRLLWGAAWSGIWIGSNAAALDVSNETNRGRVNGHLQMWFFAGSALSSLAGGVLTDWFGFRAGLWISFVLMVGAVLIWAIFMQETRSLPEHIIAKNASVTSPAPFSWKTSLLVSIPIFITRMIFAGVVSSTTILWVRQFVPAGFSLGSWLIPLATLTGTYNFLRVSVGILSAPISGYLSDRLERRWLVMGLFLVVGAGGLYMMGLPDFSLAIIGSLLAAIASGCIQALVPAAIGDRVPEKQRGRSLGVVYTMGDVGSALGPSVGLGLIPWIGLPNTYVLCALIYGAVSLFAFLQMSGESRWKASSGTS